MDTYVRDGDYTWRLLDLLSKISTVLWFNILQESCQRCIIDKKKLSYLLGDIRGKLNYCFLERCLFLKSLLTWLREKGSNLRPSGYEPDELPLLYPAILVEVIGVEPMTLCLQSRCSSQLSYTPNIQETSFKHSTIKLITKTLFKLCYRGIEPLPSFYQK